MLDRATRDPIAANFGRVHQLFGSKWPKAMEELSRELAA